MGNEQRAVDVSGHRKRLRERFRNGGRAALADYEMVELMLGFATPLKDCKPLAKALIKEFGSLRCILQATPQELSVVKGVGEATAFTITFCRELCMEYLRQEAFDTRPIFGRAGDVFSYLYMSMGSLKTEEARLFLLNSSNTVIEEMLLSSGTAKSAKIDTQQGIKRALSVDASGLIYVHNHPSGKTEPSISDKNATKDLLFAAKAVGLELLDHVIIGKDTYYSFAESGLIEKYEDDYHSVRSFGVSVGEARKSTSRRKVFGEPL